MKIAEFVIGFSMLTMGCATAPTDALTPRNVAADVLTRGNSIYFGRVFPLEGASSPTFVYERRVDVSGPSQVSTHITREPTGTVVLAESATENPDHELVDYTLHTNQLGQSGSIRIHDGQVSFRTTQDNEVIEGTEEVSDPVAVGPTLVGFVVRRLPELRRGSSVDLRLAVLDRLETIGFRLEATSAAPGQTRIRMSPTNFLYGLAIDPIYFTFDSSDDKLMLLEGRVPPKVREGEKWKDFDARVEYQFVAASYI